MTSRNPIPYTITKGTSLPVIFIETWPGRSGAGESGTGYLRTFDEINWPTAAAYISELQAGHVSGEY